MKQLNFVNTNTEEFHGVWVYCEQRRGALMSTSLELISEGRKLADELGCELAGVLLGDEVDGLVPELGGYGLLEQAAKKRGFLLSRGEYDIERMANTLLGEYHEGKLGRLSLETPDD